MSQQIDLLVTNASQICTVPASGSGPQRGQSFGDVGIIESGSIAIDHGQIIAVGNFKPADYKARQILDVKNRVITPGFVDPHTHAVWVGDRAEEFEMRVSGASYMEIMNAGGGINSTVQKVRSASLEQIINETRPRLDRFLANGTTTVEIKTGYGLDTDTELKLLSAIYHLSDSHPLDIVATFLGAHAIPPEYKGRTDAYVELVIDEMIPAIVEFAHAENRPLAFIDVFCEDGVFDVTQSKKILEAGRDAGLPLKIHADEFVGLGGTKMAVELGATSADHLVATPVEDIKALGQGNTVAVGLAPTPFGLGHYDFTPAREIIDAGGALAIATDCNPGTAWCESMQTAMSIACRYMKLTPGEALVASTLNSAYAVGMGDSAGSIEVGKQADILILDTPDYRHLGYRFGTNLVDTVIKAGEIIVQSGQRI